MYYFNANTIYKNFEINNIQKYVLLIIFTENEWNIYVKRDQSIVEPAIHIQTEILCY